MTNDETNIGHPGTSSIEARAKDGLSDGLLENSFTIDSRSLVERVADRIETLIAERKFAPGQKLPNEHELSALAGVGRSTLREAIKFLVSRNVLEIRRGAGTFVSEHVGITSDPLGLRFEADKRKLALDLCEVRLIVEPGIAQLAAVRATDTDISDIQTLCDEVAALIRAGENYAGKDIAFHIRIAESSKNSVIPKVIPIIGFAIDVFVDLTNHARAGEAARTHQAVVDAIRGRDPQGAFDAMERHLKDNRETLLALFDEQK